ncbi:hypothetical protein K5D32_08735 [Pseudomonas cichorii]|uniref:hypothetical protein n=1 Tax=Pseudomonas cichorii TaxID=36746 RepID=UPI001C8AFBC6|nr:hypothetical protein [Pseudomonas cichorii]MBX8529743.1 hypothetical protein [Pseudomonas cichorii]
MDQLSGPRNDKGQSCKAVTYRKKRELLQLANLTKHFSVSAQGQVNCGLACYRAQDENFYTSRALTSFPTLPA